MPDRILRDELWQSERFLDLPTDACRLTFLRMVSEADDFGNLEGGVRRLFRMLSACTQIKTEAATAATLSALIDADLIRGYQVDGHDLVHIPRFRSKRWYLARKVPASPWCDATKALGKTERAEKQALAPNVDTTLLQRSINVAQGVGVGVGVGKNIVPTALVDKVDPYRPPDCPFSELKAAYHELCPSLRKIVVDTAMRQKHCHARWVQVSVAEKWGRDQTLEWFRWFFAEVEKSDFLTGRRGNADRPWKADFQWLMTAGNFAKVIEGKYEREKA
jgi:hypothetical protein